MKIGCVILAGGKSSRMGQDKALLEWNGKTFIEQIEEICSDFEEKWIARGDLSPICQDGWKEISDIYLERGPMGGLHSALTHCTSEALFCVSCDIPFLHKKLVNRICREIDEKTDAVIPVTADGRKNPLCGIYKK